MISHTITKYIPVPHNVYGFDLRKDHTKERWDEAVRRCRFKVGDVLVFDPSRTTVLTHTRTMNIVLEIRREFNKDHWPSYFKDPPIMHVMALGGYSMPHSTLSNAFDRWTEDDPSYRPLTTTEEILLQDDNLQDYIKNNSARILRS